MMTGAYNFRNYTHFGYLNPTSKTIGHLMKEAGYKTAIAGKWQLNGNYNKKEFPNFKNPARVNEAGFDEYCLWQLTKSRSESGERFWSPRLEMNGGWIDRKANHKKYGPDVMSDFLCDFMVKHRDEPFFVYYPTVLVHDPFVPSPDDVRDDLRGPKHNRSPKDPKIRKENFASMMTYMDKIIGKIMTHLEDINQLENTLILFTSDNGTHKTISSNAKGRTISGGKALLEEKGTHVPLLAYWKGKTLVGHRSKALVDFTDFYSTLQDLVKATHGDGDPTDGMSFLPHLFEKNAPSRSWVLCHHQSYWGKNPVGAFVKNEEYKLYDDGRFYHLASDPEEKKDLMGAPLSDKGMSMHRRLKKVMDQVPEVNRKYDSKGELMSGTKIKDRRTYPNWNLPKP
jgi:arylsulfatase A-like enzyme